MQTADTRCVDPLPTIYLTLTAATLALAMVELLHKHTLSTGLAYLYVALLAALNAVLPRILDRPAAHAALLSWLPRLALASSSAWTLLIAASHKVDAWDEGAHVLSGLALRGYPVPYAAHRPPVASWLAALFADIDFLVNPALLGLLLLLVYRWSRTIAGPTVAAISVIVLLSQNLLLEASVDFLTELPAALLLTAGFHSLALQRHTAASLLLSLSIFTRWNLAPISAVVFLFALWQRQRRFLFSLCLSALAILIVWYSMTTKLVAADPFALVYGHFLNARSYSESPEQVVNFFTRSEFYISHFFFLTPPVALGLILVLRRGRFHQTDARSKTEQIVIPACLIVYLLVMLHIGGLFPRFVTPIIPSALISVISGIKALFDDCGVAGRAKIKIFATLVFITCGWGAWPLYSLVLVRTAMVRPPVFEEQTRNLLRQIPRETRLCALAVRPLSLANGHPAMVEIRREISFPTAFRDFTGALLDEAATPEAFRKLGDACGPGTLLLIPAQHQDKFSAELRLHSDGVWALVRNP